MHELFLQECVHLLDQSLARIRHCIDQLNHEQLWWQPGEKQNSIGMVMRHVAGNLQQWAISGVTDSADLRNRDSEFHAVERQSADQLFQALTDVATRAKHVVTGLRPNTLLELRTIQGFDVSVLGSLMHTIPHLVGHTHQIVTLTRMQLGSSYRFHWNPEAPRDKVPL